LFGTALRDLIKNLICLGFRLSVSMDRAGSVMLLL
jgi:hypothetical protein